MKKCFPAIFGIFLCPFLFSQILTVNSTSSVSISSGSSITLDGLEIAPDDPYVISGANDVSRSSTAATAGTNSSVSRVYSSFASYIVKALDKVENEEVSYKVVKN